MSAAAARAQHEETSTAELFTSEGRQAVRLPAGIHLEGDTVQVREVDGGLLLAPTILHRKRTREEIQAMFDYIDSLGADPLFPGGREQGVFEERLPID